MNNIFGGIFLALMTMTMLLFAVLNQNSQLRKKNMESNLEENCGKLYCIANSVLIILSKALTLARAAVKSDDTRIALLSCSQSIFFVKAVLKVQRKNVTGATLPERDRTVRAVKESFGPIH